MNLLSFLDYASVFVFALTGGLVASRAQFDIVGFAFIACLTAVGGGTLRDVMLDRNPIFWIAQPAYIGVACAGALVVYFAAHTLESRLRALIWLDTFALAIAVAAGTGVAMSLGQPVPVVLLMGMITGCMGGLMRDVVVGDVPVVLRHGELYVSAAFAGAATALIARPWFADPLIPLAICAGTTWVLRAGSVGFGWSLPTYKHEPPKEK